MILKSLLKVISNYSGDGLINCKLHEQHKIVLYNNFMATNVEIHLIKNNKLMVTRMDHPIVIKQVIDFTNGTLVYGDITNKNIQIEHANNFQSGNMQLFMLKNISFLLIKQPEILMNCASR